MMKSYSKKDFEVQWFSGTGKGGQHRNKHQNCCRIIHLETGLKATGQRSRERSKNLDDAFRALVAKLVAFHSKPEERRFLDEVLERP
jgi:protein subunit release factor A